MWIRRGGFKAVFTKGVAFKMALEEMAFQEAAGWMADKHCPGGFSGKCLVENQTHPALQEEKEEGKDRGIQNKCFTAFLLYQDHLLGLLKPRLQDPLPVSDSGVGP